MENMGGIQMKNKIKRIGIIIVAVIIMLGATVVFSEPGSEDDPLVTLSYVNKKIEQLKYYIDEKLAGNAGASNSNEFIVVELVRGQSLILGGSSEAILRSGEARSISRILNGIDNGLCDITVGADIKMDQLIKENHLLLSPRDDGRGARASKDTIFLVRGTYEIR